MKAFLHYFIVILLFGVTTTNAQNLVVNPSFEITTSNCANSGGESFPADLAGSWDNANSVIGADSCTSPDLFSLCNTIPGNPMFPAPTAMPNSQLGYQYSRTGTRHAGIILHEPLDEYREYIQGRTTSPLVAGKTYEVSLYVSLANEMPFATNSIGVRFSNTHYQRDACHNGVISSAIYLTPQLNYADSSATAITDTANWVQLKWNYVAAGGEQYFIIGNFFNNLHTVITNTGKPQYPNPFAYYYIDDVSIEAIHHCSDSLAFAHVLQPGCGTSNGSLSASVIALPADTFVYSYLWNTGATTNNLTGLGTGTYTVTASNSAGCHIVKSYVLTNVFADSVSLTTVDATCGQNNGLITVNINSSINHTYYWNIGATAQTIANLAKGAYSVTVTFANGCVVVDSTIIGRPVINVTAAGSGICFGDSVQVCAPNGYSGYLWSNGATTSCIYAYHPTHYNVSVTDNSGCTEVSADIVIDSLHASQVTAVVSGNHIVAVANGAHSFQWFSDSGVIALATSQTYIPSQAGNYSVEVTNNDGCKSVSNVVHFGLCSAGFHLYADSLTVHNWFALLLSTGAQPITYNWHWGDGTSSTGFTHHTYASPGTYNICLSIIDANGCTDSYCDSSVYLHKTEADMVTVNVVSELPNAISETTGEALIMLYPNPANNLLFVKAGELKISSIRIYDVNGSLVKTVQQLNAGEGIDVSELPAGVYVAVIATKNASIRKRWLKM